MRVGLIANRLRVNEPTSGMTRYIENLVQYLPQYESDLELVLLGSDFLKEKAQSLDEKIVKKIATGALSEVPLPGFPRQRPASIKSARYWLDNLNAAKAVNKLNLDVIHSPVQGAPLYFWFTKLPKVITIHGVSDVFTPSKQNWRLSLGVNVKRWQLGRQKPTIITVSQAAKATISQVYRQQADVIYHCLELNSLGTTLSYQEANLRVVQRYGIPSRFLLHLSHYQPVKNLPNVLRAMALLRDEKNLRVPLVVAGQAKYGFDEVEDTIRDLELQDQVTMTGQVQGQELLDLLCGAYALVVASFHESFGIPVLEGMMCGTPVIASNVYALPEVTGGAALLIDPYIPASIATAIERLWESETLHEELRLKGLRRAEDFSPKSFADAHIKTYEKARMGS